MLLNSLLSSPCVFIYFAFSFCFFPGCVCYNAQLHSLRLVGLLAYIDSKPSSFISLCVTSMLELLPKYPKWSEKYSRGHSTKKLYVQKNVNSALFFLFISLLLWSNDCCTVHTRTNEPVFRLSSHVDVWRLPKDSFFFFFYSFWGFPFFVLACHPRLPSEICEDCVLLSTGLAE